MSYWLGVLFGLLAACVVYVAVIYALASVLDWWVMREAKRDHAED